MTSRVIYHYPCADGVFAALAAAMALPASSTFHPLTVYSSEESRAALAASFAAADTVFLLDFSGGVPLLKALCASTSRVVLVDHHLTAAQDVAALGAAAPPNLEVHVDMARSGCALARDFFGVGARADWPARACDLVEDHDLFRHALADSLAFASGLAARRIEYDVGRNAGLWAALRALDVDALVREGAELAAREAAIIAAEVQTAFAVALPVPGGAPLRCLALVTAHPDLRSNEGNALAAASEAAGLAPAGLVAYLEPGAAEGLIKVSARSLRDVDVTPAMRAHGGGGHRNAASCLVPLATWAAWRE